MSTATAAIPATGDTLFGTHLLRLVGEPFLFVRTSYGDELVLHFGERRADPVRIIKGREFRYEFGTYRLHTRGSAWLIKSGVGLATGGLAADLGKVADPIRAADATERPPLTPGVVVTGLNPFPVFRAGVNGIGLRVDLADGSAVVVIPTPDEGDETAPAEVTLGELADWELTTPAGRLAVGPGRKWQWAAEKSAG